jgi:predicted HTH domain antitoxin
MAESLERIADALQRIAEATERGGQVVVAALPPEALSKEDAARFIGVDVGAIEQLIRTRKIAYVQYGSQRGRVIPVESLRKFLKEHREASIDELLTKRGA